MDSCERRLSLRLCEIRLHSSLILSSESLSGGVSTVFDLPAVRLAGTVGLILSPASAQATQTTLLFSHHSYSSQGLLTSPLISLNVL